jgi:FkbM family methyltransferase
MSLRSLLARLLGAPAGTEPHAIATATPPARPAQVTAPDPAQNLDENAALASVFTDDTEPGVMIDVGAHFGSTTLPFLERGWRVLGFEPDKKKHAALAAIADKHPGLFELFTCAVGDKPHPGVQFYTSTESTGIASLVPFRETHTKGDLVPVRTLREVTAERGVDRLDYLKIDAEGYDLRVLEGFPFDRLTPRAVMCEFEDAKTTRIGYGTHDLGRFLTDRGYAVYLSEWHPIVRYGITHRWRSIRRYPCRLHDERGWGNFLAVRPGDAEQRFRLAIGDRLTP